MLKIHKTFSKHKLFTISITSILSIGVLLGLSSLMYTPELSYAETVTYEPEETRTMENITYMQEVTPEICQNSELNRQYTLIDSRDNSDYTVARIKNQTNDESNCWMTQNLRLVGERILTPSDSDVYKNFILPASTMLSGAEFSENDALESKLYYEEDINYGAYYNWYTATAGTGKYAIDIQNINARGSICPKSWRLPTGESKSGDFYNLLNSLNSASITADPYRFLYGGHIGNNISAVENKGTWGYYYSSTHHSSLNAYYISFSKDYLFLSAAAALYYGESIRCIVREDNIGNVNIFVAPTISLDVMDAMIIEKIENNPSTASLDVKVSSNQPYTVAISASDPVMRSSTASVTIPAKSGLLNTAENGWGIKLKESSEFFTAVTNDLQTFYTASGAEVKTIPFTIGISTSPDIPNGEYSTDITVTATQN